MERTGEGCMSEYVFEDALARSIVSCGFPQLEIAVERVPGDPRPCSSVFFPGCSLINYGLPLVNAMYDTLSDAGCVDGVSLLCCGKILSYEPDGDAVRASFEEQLRASLRSSEVERIVAACPNCVQALRAALAADERTAGIQVVALPAVLADLGYRIDEGVARRLLAQETGVAASEVRASVHDSCPDRDTGEFADGVRALMPADLVVELAHIRKRSYCCGSLLRAVGKFDRADDAARRHGQEARAAGSSAFVVACMSCALQLETFAAPISAFHYLELLYDWRIDWSRADSYMKLRFLFDDALDAVEGASSSRAFASLGAPEAACAVGAGQRVETSPEVIS